MNPTMTLPSRAGTGHQTRSAPRQPWQLGATAVVWLTSLMVVALWVRGGGIQDVVGLGSNLFLSLGRLSGLVSANLLLLQVLLMAQVPLFEKGLGRAGITRMHRLTGMWSFALLVAHIVLITMAYSLEDKSSLLSQFWDFTVHYPDMILAEIAVLLIILVMVTSARRARRRLRYERWHLLHLYAYVGVGLSIPHMLSTGGDFVTSPLATAYWWTLWALAAGCVVVFRVTMPLLHSWAHGLRVTDVAPDGSRGVTVRMSGRRLDLLGAQAGQFFTWRFLDGPGWTRGHPFSLSAAPTPTTLQISARIVGDGTRSLTTLRPGTRVLIEGPFGHMTGEERTGGGLLMIAAGAGVAPMVSLLESEPFRPGQAVLLTRDHDAGERMGAAAIQHLIDSRGLLHYAIDGPRNRQGTAWLPARYAGWRGDELLTRLAPSGHRGRSDVDVYLCGPDPWMAEVRADLQAAGFDAGQIHSESFSSVPGAGPARKAARAPRTASVLEGNNR